jgi:methyl-accepting chemotaxis protein
LHIRLQGTYDSDANSGGLFVSRNIKDLGGTYAVGITFALVALSQLRFILVREPAGLPGVLFGALSLLLLLAALLLHLRERNRQRSDRESTLNTLVGNLGKSRLGEEWPTGRETNGLGGVEERLRELGALLSGIRSSALESESAGRKLAAQVGETLAAIAQIASHSAGTEKEVQALSDSVVQGASAMEEILAAIESLVARIGRQNGIVEESASAVEEMSASIHSVAEVARTKREASDALAELTVTGSSRVRQTETVIDEVAQQVGSVRAMITVINEVAARTNMLAMNAAIEAAHAGQYGRGFAVVADEIRSLAESTSKNASTISKTLGELVARIQEARKVSQETGEAFRSIEEGAHSVSQAFAEISASTDELSIGTREVVKATESLSQISREITGSAQEMRVGASEVTEVITGAKDAARETRNSMETIRSSAAGVNSATNRISRLSVATNDRVLDLLERIGRYTQEQEGEEKLAAERLGLANIILGHMSWVADVREQIDISGTQEFLETVQDAGACDLGQWLALEGKTTIREPEAYRRVVETHRRLHEQAARAVEAAMQGAYQEREAVFGELLESSREIVEMLTAQQRDDSVRWTPDISVQVPVFDEHHKRLFATINKLYNAMKAGASREALKEVFDELIDYTNYHFGSEEKALDQVGSSLCAVQRSEHQELIGTAMELRRDLEEGKPMVAVEVMEFLRDWVTGHIKGCDKLYAEVLRNTDVESILSESHG